MKKRRAFIVFIIIAILAIAGLGGYYVLQLYDATVKNLHDKTIEQEDEIFSLNEDLEYYESLLIETFCFNKTMQAGAVITEDDIEFRESTVTATPHDVFTNKSDIIGKVVKISCTEGTVVTQSLTMNDQLKADSRELDLVLDEVPIAVKEGDYVDIRISFPLGQDYIAMSHKKVIGVYDNVLKLIVGQEDIYAYESMKTDASIYIATKLYAIKYIEPGIQATAMTYYPVSREIMQTMILDKNMDTKDFSEVLDARLALETILNESEKVEKKRTVTTDKAVLVNDFKNAQALYERLQKQKEQENKKK